MHFGLSETQEAIRKSARQFFSAECPMDEVRRLAETDTAMDDAVWKKFAEQGWTGIIFPEAYNGFGLGLVEMAVAMEEMGRALIPGPFISTVLVAGTILDLTGTEEQKQKYLAGICRGESKATLALLEKSASWDVNALQLSASSASGSGFVINGEKLFVADAAGADFLLVALRVQGEICILIVPADADGINTTLMPGIDLTRRLYSVSFTGVAVPAANLLARGVKAVEAIEAAHDVACVGLVAEMAGGMQRLLDMTVEYAKTRKQFGKPIGTFQAVQHQCADILFLLEGTRSAAYYAAWALGENAPGARSAVSVAKAYASEGYREAGNRAIQVHGGMGFTWENDAHLFYRRAKGSEIAFGDAAFHRERIARAMIDRD